MKEEIIGETSRLVLNLVLRARTPAPPTVYHYTSAAGIMGILSSQSMWATHYAFLNDRMEFAAATSVFKHIAASMLKEVGEAAHQPFTNAPSNEHELRASVCKVILGLNDLTRAHAPFVISFSEHGDLLSQWRAYGDGGHGYSIGASTHSLFKGISMQPDAPRWLLVPVIYDPAEHLQIADTCMASALETMSKLLASSDGRDERARLMREGIDSLLFLIVAFAPLLKHPSFAEEREWRLIASGIKPELALAISGSESVHSVESAAYLQEEYARTGLRPSNRRLVPYEPYIFSGELSTELFREIVVGPCNDRVQANMSLRLLLFKSLSKHSINVRHSQVPYQA
jgi:hypothetical protein